MSIGILLGFESGSWYRMDGSRLMRLFPTACLLGPSVLNRAAVVPEIFPKALSKENLRFTNQFSATGFPKALLVMKPWKQMLQNCRLYMFKIRNPPDLCPNKLIECHLSMKTN